MTMTISQMAERHNVTNRALRFYQDKGLLFPEQNESGRRTYSAEDDQILTLILLGQSIGLTLDEIKECISDDRTQLKLSQSRYQELSKEAVARLDAARKADRLLANAVPGAKLDKRVIHIKPEVAA